MAMAMAVETETMEMVDKMATWMAQLAVAALT